MGIRQDFIVGSKHPCGDLDFEDGGNPVVMNRVLAACDPVLVDAYVCQMMHYQVEDVPYVNWLVNWGLAVRISAKQRSFSARKKQKRFCPIPQGCRTGRCRRRIKSCSACYGYLIPALEMLKEEGLFEKLHEKICIGQGYRGQNGELGVGHCTC